MLNSIYVRCNKGTLEGNHYVYLFNDNGSRESSRSEYFAELTNDELITQLSKDLEVMQKEAYDLADYIECLRENA